MNAQRSPFFLFLFAGLLFFLFVLMALAILPKKTTTFTDEEVPTDLSLIQDYDPILGDASAEVIIFHYSDFLCTSCGDIADSLSRIAQDYGDSVAIVWKDFPNVTAHPLAPGASIAARCAGKQDAFWEYHDMLFANQDQITQATAMEVYTLIAEDLDLGMWRFNRCLDKQQTFDDLESSYRDALDAELTSAPALRINDEWFTGIISEQELRSIITSQPLNL